MYILRNVISNERLMLLLIFVIALTLRIIATINLPASLHVPTTDALEYDKLATSLVTGKGLIDFRTGLSSSWRVPLYPLFLAFIYSIFGHSYIAVRIIQSIMGASLCILIFYIAKATFNKRVALLAATLLAFYQPYIFYSFYGGPTFLLSENLFIFLFAILLLFLMRNLFVQFSLKNSAIAGILIGLLVLTRPIIILFPFFLFGLLLYKNKYSFIFTAKKMLPFAVAFMLVLLPWIARNYYIHKAFIPISTEGGFVLFSGNNPYVRGGGLPDVDHLLTEEERSGLGQMSEVQKNAVYRRHAKEFLFKNYKKLPKLYFKKLLVLWDVYIVDYYIDYGKRKYNIWYSTILVFSLFGILKSVKSKLNINSLLLISLFLYFCLIAVIFSGDPRFRYTVEPYLIIFTSVGAFAIYNRFANKFFSYAIIAIIIGTNSLIYTHSDLVLHWVRDLLKSQGL